MSSILAAFLSGPLCVKAAPHDRTSYFIRCRTLNSEAHVSLFYYGCEHTRDWYGSLQGRFPHNGLFILLLCIYYDFCLAPCTFTVNKLLLLLLLLHEVVDNLDTHFFTPNAILWQVLILQIMRPFQTEATITSTVQTPCGYISANLSITLHWRHNDHDSVSNHQPHGCLLNRLFRRRSKKTSKLRVTGLCVGNSPGPVNSPHKGPVTRKMFPFDDVIMIQWNKKSEF